ncbi:hypothetical protein N9C35_03065 [Flavobacteriaceae bacterium]|nr:hypothetical protein [Flavobacteriaceae bacterium]
MLLRILFAFLVFFSLFRVGVASEELIFDLPKDDPKEQCAEVERIYKKILDIQKTYRVSSYTKDSSFWQLHKIGNVYAIPINSYDYGGYIMLVLNKYGRYVGIGSEVVNSRNTYYFGNSNILYLDVNKKSYPHKIETKGCHITSLKFNYKT